MPERYSRREALQKIVLGTTAATTWALIQDRQHTSVVTPPNTLPHLVEFGFTYGPDEAARLELNLHDFKDLTKMGFSFIRFPGRLDRTTQTDFDVLRAFYDQAKSENLQIVQALGPRQPYYNPDEGGGIFPPPGVRPNQPDYQERCLKATQRYIDLLDGNDMLKYVDYTVIGNEPLTEFKLFNLFSLPSVPPEPVAFVEQLRDVIKPIGKPTIINDFVNILGPEPLPSWLRAPSLADIVAMDIYSQVSILNIPVDSVAKAIDAHLRAASGGQEDPWAMEIQSKSWPPGQFTVQDFKNLAYTVMRRCRRNGLWEVDKMKFEEKRKDPIRLNATRELMEQVQSLNAQYRLTHAA